MFLPLKKKKKGFLKVRVGQGLQDCSTLQFCHCYSTWMSKLVFLNFHFYSQAQKAKQSEKPNPKGYSSWRGRFLTLLAGFLNNEEEKKKNPTKKIQGNLTKSFPG